MSEEMLLDEIKNAPPEKREAILSYAYFVLHGEDVFLQHQDDIRYIPFINYQEVDDFLEFHQQQIGVI
jgi:hypothetical protein